MKNRVLTLDEVLALPEGARVWVEDEIQRLTQHTVCYDYCDAEELNGSGEVYALALVDEHHKFWPIDLDVMDEYFGRVFRVWSLPQPPTPDDLQANPWPEVT